MMLVLNLSRSYRGLAFRVTLSLVEGKVMEVMERKRTVLQFDDSLSGAAWEMEPKLGSNKTLDNGIQRQPTTASRTHRDKCDYRRSSSFKHRSWCFRPDSCLDALRKLLFFRCMTDSAHS